MSNAGHTFYIVVAYGGAVVLLAVEVWALVRRSREQARQSAKGPRE